MAHLPTLTLITATRDRPEAFALCERWMRRQTIKIPYPWIVVDDGDTPATLNLKQVHRRRPPGAGPESLALNLLAAVEGVTTDYVLFIEDDDWYPAHYLEQMLVLGSGADLCGELYGRYYHFGVPGSMLEKPFPHSQLMRTMMSRRMIPALQQACRLAMERGTTSIDKFLWGYNPGVRMPFEPRKQTFSTPKLSIGMKGLPGRPGLGVIHRRPEGFTPDPGGRVLEEWIGDEVEHYRRFLSAQDCRERVEA